MVRALQAAAAGVPRPLLGLNRGAWDRAVGTEDATIPGFRAKLRLAIWADVKPLTSIRRHGFKRGAATLWTGDDRFEHRFSGHRELHAFTPAACPSVKAISTIERHPLDQLKGSEW